jgi:hypothetical protein
VNFNDSFATLSTTGWSGSGTVTFAVTNTGTANCSASWATLSYTTVGTCDVTATKSADINYNVVSSIGTIFTIDKATPTISISNSPVIYNGSSQSATLSGSVAGIFSSVLYDGSATIPTAVWTVVVTADFTPTDTTNYNSITGVSAGNFIIDKITPTISISNSPVTYNGGIQSATLSGSVAGIISSVLYNGLAAVPTNGWIYAVTADFIPTDTTNYNSGTGVSAGNFVIDKATPTISVSNSPVIYNGNAQSAIIYGSVPGMASSILYDGSSTIPTNVWTYVITADFTPTDTTNYNSITGVSAGNFTINKATPTISISNSPVTYNGSTQSATLSGSVAGIFSSVLYDGSATIPTAVWIYAITADFTPTDTTNYNSITGISVGNFEITIADQALLILTAQTVAFPSLFTTLSTTGWSGTGPVTFVVTDTGTANCSVSWTTLSYTTIGNCSITATKASDTNYNVASSVKNFTVLLVAATVVTPTLGNPVVGTAEPGSTVLIVTPSGATCTTLADGRWIYNCILSSTPLIGENINVSATDALGNNSALLSITAWINTDLDTDLDGITDSIETLIGTSSTGSTTNGIDDNDNDQDGISALIELNAQNYGDGNGDGILDAIQLEVASNPNLTNSGSNTLAVSSIWSSQVTMFKSIKESSLNTQDTWTIHPIWLWAMNFKTNTWATVNIKIYLDTVYDTSNWKYKKYNETTEIHTDISPIVTYVTETVGIIPVTVIMYSVTDGWIYDDDGVANGEIIDPSGPTVSTVAQTSGWRSSSYRRVTPSIKIINEDTSKITNEDTSGLWQNKRTLEQSIIYLKENITSTKVIALIDLLAAKLSIFDIEFYISFDKELETQYNKTITWLETILINLDKYSSTKDKAYLYKVKDWYKAYLDYKNINNIKQRYITIEGWIYKTKYKKLVTPLTSLEKIIIKKLEVLRDSETISLNIYNKAISDYNDFVLYITISKEYKSKDAGRMLAKPFKNLIKVYKTKVIKNVNKTKVIQTLLIKDKYTFNKNLKLKNYNDDVKNLQTIMKLYWYFDYNPTAYFWNETKKSLIRFSTEILNIPNSNWIFNSLKRKAIWELKFIDKVSNIKVKEEVKKTLLIKDRYIFNKNLQLKKYNDDVKNLQTIMKSYWYFDYNPTGYFWNETKKSLIRFSTEILNIPNSNWIFNSLKRKAIWELKLKENVIQTILIKDKYTFNKNLQLKKYNDDVKNLQTIMKSYWYFDYNPTGYFWNETKKSLIRFSTEILNIPNSNWIFNSLKRKAIWELKLK